MLRSLRFGPSLLVFAAVAILLVTTLAPIPQAGGGRSAVTLSLHLADALRNVVLLLPLGLGLAWAGLAPRHVALAGLLLSIGVELAQLLIPGRRTSPWDPVANTLGAWLGALAMVWFPRLRRLPESVADRAALGASLAGILAVCGTSWLLGPQPSQGPLFAHETPVFEPPLLAYDGRLERIELDGRALTAPRIADPDDVRARLAGDHRIALDAIAGTPPAAHAPLFAIGDSEERFLSMLTVVESDVHYQQGTRGDLIRLEPNRVVVRDALTAVRPGDPFSVVVERSGHELCLGVKVAGTGARECQRIAALAGGWRAFSPFTFGVDGARRLDALWMGLLLIPFGLWARRGPGTLAGASLGLVAAFAIPPLFGVAPLTGFGLGGAAVGAGLGWSLRARA